jgi:hypothetical protein
MSHPTEHPDYLKMMNLTLAVEANFSDIETRQEPSGGTTLKAKLRLQATQHTLHMELQSSDVIFSTQHQWTRVPITNEPEQMAVIRRWRSRCLV